MKIRKRALSLVLAIVMLFSLLGPGALAIEGKTFLSDYSGHWAEETITKWYDNDWIDGYPDGTFKPDRAVTRAELAKMVNNSFDYTEKTAIDFSDVTETSWFYAEVQRIAAAGIMEGYSGKFEPDVNITREQSAAVSTRILDLTSEPEAVKKFPDADQISDWALDEVGAAVAANIFRGKDNGKLEPKSSLTRAEAITILDRIIDLKEENGNPTIRSTKYGQVQGFIQDDSLVWLGVPYGAAPVDELRWKSPQSPEPWDDVRDATEPGIIAIQTSGGGEDCLNLDIYRPNNNDKNLPVLFFIHGGNNQTGASGDLNGSLLAAQGNCIVVSVNYRLGLLGFNPLSALKTGTDEENSGNYAILDIVFALDWVAENISAFGGDPQNITVSGHSAGGRDVMALLISPIAKDKFQKAISFSGGMTTAEQAPSEKVVAKYLAPLVTADGVKNTEDEAYEWLLSDDEEVAEYLYSLDAERLAKLIGDAGIRMSVFPHLFTDGTVLPKEGFETTTYNEVPLIMLTSTGEFSTFAMSSAYFQTSEYNSKSNEEKQAEMDFALKYGSLLYKNFNAQASAEQMYASFDAPIYVCEFNFGADKNEWGTLATMLGSFHGVWMPLVDKSNMIRNYFKEQYESDGAAELSQLYIAYLSNFLWEGDPNGDDLARWDAWKDTSRLSMVFDANREKALISLSDTSVYYSDIISAIETDDTITGQAKNDIVSTVLNGRWFSYQLDNHFGTPSLWPN